MYPKIMNPENITKPINFNSFEYGVSTVGNLSVNPIAAHKIPTKAEPNDEIILSTALNNVPINPGT